MRDKISQSIALPVVVDSKCQEDVRKALGNKEARDLFLRSYKDKEDSPILIIAMQMLGDPDIGDSGAVIELIVALVKKGAGVKYKAKGNTFAHYAIKYIRTEALYDCISTVYPNKNESGATLLHAAVFHDNMSAFEIDRVSKLWEGMLFEEMGGITALDVAVILNKPEVIKRMVILTNNPPMTKLCGANVLKLAIDNESLDALRYMLSDCRLYSSIIQDALVHACIINNKGNLKALEIIIKSFANNNSSLRVKSQVTGNTAMHEVIASNIGKTRKQKIIKRLLEHDKGLLDVTNHKNRFPLELAMDEETRDFIIAMKRDADTNPGIVPTQPRAVLQRIFRDNEIGNACEALIKSCELLQPEEAVETLSIIHNIQSRYNIKELIDEVNDLFIKCAPYFKKDIKDCTVGYGLICDRVDFLKKEGNEEQGKVLLEALKKKEQLATSSRFSLWWFQSFISAKQPQVNQVAEISKAKAVASVKLRSGKKHDTMYNEGISEYANAFLGEKEYVKAAMCYDVLRQNSIGDVQKKAQEGLCIAEAQLILSIPSSSAYAVLGTNRRLMREAGKLFLLCDRYDEAIKIYRQTLRLLQEELKEADSIETRNTERELFVEFAYACCQELKVVHDLDVNRTKLNKMYGELRNMPSSVVLQRWDAYLIREMQRIAEEACAQLGNKFGCAVIVTGEMARREACLYPEIQMMIITEKSINSSNDYGAYFNALAKLIEIKLISLGGMQSLPKELLVNDNTQYRSGIRYKSVRIGTVLEFSAEVYDKSTQDTLLLNNHSIAKKLHEDFLKARRESPQNKAEKLCCFRLLRDIATMTMISGNTDIQDIMRFPTSHIISFPISLVAGLCSYHGLEAPLNTSLRIDKLVEVANGISLNKLEDWDNFLLYYFTARNAEGLKAWLELGYELRLKAQVLCLESHNHDESVGRTSIDSLSQEYLERYTKLYQEVILPFREMMNLWLEMLSESELELPKAWFGSVLREKVVTLKTSAEIAKTLLQESHKLMCKYQETKKLEYNERANWYFEKAVALDLNIVETEWLGSIASLNKAGDQDNMLEFFDGAGQRTQIVLSQEHLRRILEDKDKCAVMEVKGSYFYAEISQHPGIEYAVSSLSHSMLGYTTAPFCTLAKLTTKDGNVIPISISRYIIGNQCALRAISNAAFGLSIVRSILSNPQSDEIKHFKVQNILSPRGVKEQRLMCVNNAYGLMEKCAETGTYWFLGERYISKSILYCSDKMQDVMPEEIRQKIMGLKVEVITDWLKKVIDRDICNQKLFPEMQTKLYEATCINICYKILKLQEMEENTTYVKVLDCLDNTAYELYKPLYNSLQPLKERFNTLLLEEKRLTQVKSRYLVGYKAQQSSVALSELSSLLQYLGTLPKVRKAIIDGAVIDHAFPVAIRKILINGCGFTIGSSVFEQYL